ncbi:hypothetical protein V1291_005055 [Nitrobacteraceae bacterium AZCC 1564]
MTRRSTNCAPAFEAVAFAESVKEAQYKGASERKIEAYWVPGKVLRAEDYLLQMTLTNFFFHLVTAYAILRNNGVELTKSDFMCPITLVNV